MIDYLISLLIFLNSVIVPMKVEPTKENLYSFYNNLNSAYVEMGYDSRKATIFFDNIDGARGATYSLPYSPFPWCDGKIGIGMQYKYPSYKYYETIDIYSTLGHESAHVYQSVNCQSKTVEAGATLMSLKAFSLMDDDISKQAFYWYLRELAMHRLDYEMCIAGKDYTACESGYAWRPYTLALDWAMAGEVIKASSLPKPIDTKNILPEFEIKHIVEIEASK